VYIRQGLGVGQLRMKYGGLNKRRGVKPEHYSKGSGGLIRHILQQFEKLGFVEKHTGACGLGGAGQQQRDSDVAAIAAGLLTQQGLQALLCSHQPRLAAFNLSVCPAPAARLSGDKGGRKISPAGQKDMDLIAGRVECKLPNYGL
jgi:ribosomal protein S19E (S16A)